MSEQIAIQDIWLGGLCLAETNAELVDVQVNGNGRKTVIFTFKGDNLSEISRAYCNQEALANVTQLRAEINRLRDLIFQARERS